jgi:hypothetical protein
MEETEKDKVFLKLNKKRRAYIGGNFREEYVIFHFIAIMKI